MTTGDGCIVTYMAFDKPTRITKGGNTVEFFYGPDRKRFKRVDNTVENGTVTTIYAAGKAYERIENAQGVTAKHYIGDFAVLTQTINTGAVAVNYLHRDHLGSVETITNEAGIVTQRMSFDAWGKRREVNWQPMGEEAIATFNTDTTTRGFTGHEQIDSVGLIHMNGRVYDAELGRFLSADPHIQALDNLQNFNRYSYVLNNPLSYTDPTGFFFSKLFKAIGKAFGKIFKAIGRAFKKLLRSPIFRAIIQIIACAGPQAVVTCPLAAGAMSLAAGGSIGDAFKAAAFSFIGGEIWGVVKGAIQGIHSAAQVLVHGVVNGALTVAQGGNFLVGFATGAIGKIGGIVSQKVFGKFKTGGFSAKIGRTFIAAIAGCTGAVISGGKCANGAVTAAMAHLFNAERTPFDDWLRARIRKDYINQCFQECALASGIPLASSAGGVIMGEPYLNKRFTVPGSSDGTSVWRHIYDRIFGRSRYDTRKSAPTRKRPGAFSRSKSTVWTRRTPIYSGRMFGLSFAFWGGCNAGCALNAHRVEKHYMSEMKHD